MSQILLPYQPELEIPSDGFDLEWEPSDVFPRPVWMQDNRSTYGKKAFDVSAYGNDAALGGTAAWVPESRGSVLDFGESRVNAAAYARIENTPVLNPTTAITMAAWVKRRIPIEGTTQQIIIAKNLPTAGSPYYQYNLFLIDIFSATRCNVNINGAWQYADSEHLSTDSVDTWYFVWGRWASGYRIECGVGTSFLGESDDAYSGTIYAQDTPLFLGGCNSGYPIGTLAGRISNAGVWNQRLSDAQIQSLYESQLNGGPGILAQSTRREYLPTAVVEPPTEESALIPYESELAQGNARPDGFRINRYSSLADDLVFAGLGRSVGGSLYEDSSLWGNSGKLINMDPETDWVLDAELGRWLCDMDGGAFDGSSALRDRIDVTRPGFTNSQPFTTSLWAIADGLNAFQGLFSTLHPITFPNWAIYTHDDGSWGVYVGGHYRSAVGKIVVGEINHFMIAYDGNTVTGWRNGAVEISQAGVSYTADNSPQSLVIGGFYATTTTSAADAHYWGGQIGDVCLWLDRCLSPEDNESLADPNNVMLSGLIEGPEPEYLPFGTGAEPPTEESALIPYEWENTKPYDGFDTEWEPSDVFPRPVWMWDNRFTGGKKLYDASGYGNDATLATDGASLPFWVAADRGPAIEFPHTNDYLSSVVLPGVMTGYTIVHWFRMAATPGFAILSDLQYSGGDGARLWFNSNATLLFDADDGTFTQVIGGEVSLNEWHFAAATINGDTATIYLDDNAPVSAGGNTFDFAGAARHLNINSRQNGMGCFVGIQQFVAAFGTALSASQIRELYYSQLNGGPGILAQSTRREYLPFGTGAEPPEYAELSGQANVVFTAVGSPAYSVATEGVGTIAFTAVGSPAYSVATEGVGTIEFTAIGSMAEETFIDVEGTSGITFDAAATTAVFWWSSGTSAIVFVAEGSLETAGTVDTAGTAHIQFTAWNTPDDFSVASWCTFDAYEWRDFSPKHWTYFTACHRQGMAFLWLEELVVTIIEPIHGPHVKDE